MYFRDIGHFMLCGHKLFIPEVIGESNPRKKSILEQGLIGERIFDVYAKVCGLTWCKTPDWFDKEKDGLLDGLRTEIKTTQKFIKWNTVALNESQNWKKWDKADRRIFNVFRSEGNEGGKIQIYECVDHKNCVTYPVSNPPGRYRAYQLKDMTLLYEFDHEDLAAHLRGLETGVS